MANNHKVTICIPAYNHEHFIAQAIESCINLGETVHKVLISDDGSTDNTAKVIKDYKNLYSIIEIPENFPNYNIGAHERINLLVDSAQTEYVAILNSDDYYAYGAFSNFNTFIKHNNPDAYFGCINIVDINSKFISVKSPGESLEYTIEEQSVLQNAFLESNFKTLILNQNFIATTSNFVFKKKIWNELQKFSENRYIHDWDFFIKSILRYSVQFNPGFFINYRVHSRNTIKESKAKVNAEIFSLFSTLTKKNEILLDIKDLDSIRLTSTLSLLRNSNLYQGQTRCINYVHPINRRKSLPISLLKNDLRLHITNCTFFENINSYTCTISITDYDQMLALRNAIAFVSLTNSDLICQVFDDDPNDNGKSPLPLLIKNTSVNNSIIDPEKVWVISIPNTSPPRRITNAELTYCKEIIQNMFNRNFELSGFNESIVPFKPRISIPKCLIKKNRILILTGFFAIGGVERVTLDIISALSYKYQFVILNLEKHIVSLGSLSIEAESIGCHVYYYDSINKKDLQSCISFLNDHYDFDLIWSINGSTIFSGLYDIWDQLLSNVPYIDNQVYDTDAGWINSFGNDISKKDINFVAINKKIYNVFKNDFGIQQDKIHLIYPSYDNSKFSLDSEISFNKFLEYKSQARSKLGIPTNSLFFINIGRCHSQKNQSAFIDIGKQFQYAQPNSLFYVIGSGELEFQIDIKIRESNSNQIIRIPFNDNLIDYYLAADALIITSIYEGLPVVLLEALSVGLPVISTDVGDCEDFINHYKCGYVFDSLKDINHVASELLTHVNHNLPTYQRNAFQSRIDIAQHHSKFSTAKKYDCLFRELIN